MDERRIKKSRGDEERALCKFQVPWTLTPMVAL
jgi:hypothetical protein